MSTISSPRAFGYARVSTDIQTESGLSLSEQEIKIRARCTEMGWPLEAVFVDAGVSGATPLGKRPQGAPLLAALRPGDRVIAARMDRVFRSSLDALQTIENFKRRGVGLLLLDLGGDVTDDGISRLILTILASVAQFERHLIAERIKDAKRNLRRAGLHQGGSVPFGYRLGEALERGRARVLVPDPAEQAAIVLARRLRADGRSLMYIRDVLRSQGFQVSHNVVCRIVADIDKAPLAEAAD